MTNVTLLSGIYRKIGGESTEPNWALIVFLVVTAIAAVTALSVILYRRWREKNCYPIYFAGKIIYGRKGKTIREILYYSPYGNGNWLVDTLQSQDSSSTTFYTDAALTRSLNVDAMLTGPLYIFPKLEK